MKKTRVTLYADDSSLRLLTVRGDQILHWAETPLEPGLVKSNVVIEEAEVANRLRQLFTDNRVSRRKVILGLSGLHCLTRPVTIPVLPKAMLDEAIKREAKRVMPVPLEQLYVSWQAKPGPEGKLNIFIVAIPCKIADSWLKTLRAAGIKTHMLDLKPLALARLVYEPTAVIVDVQAAEFDISIMSDGIPQPIRTIPLPDETLPQREKWAKLKEELDRTIKFFNSNNPEHQLKPDVPLYVSGELANRPRLDKSLSDEFGFRVLTLSSPMCNDMFEPSRCLCNIGLALKEPSKSDEFGACLVNVNSLPVPYRPKPVPVLKLVAVPGAATFIGLTVMLTLVIQDASANVASLRSQVESTNKLITQRQAKKKELTTSIADLEKRFSLAQVSHDTFIAAQKGLEKHHERIYADLSLTTGNFPSRSTLGSYNQSPTAITIRGSAPDESVVLAYARSLEPSGRYSEITVTSIMVPAPDSAVNFVISLKVRP